MPNPSTYPYRRFPTIQAGAADHAARGTDAVKQELHALCAGSSKTVVTVECYPGTDQAEILALFPHAELIIHADDLAIQPAELDAKIEHELTDDPVFGIMTTWQMKNFYPEEALCAARGKIDAVTDGLVLVYGVGASLVERADITIYADITRWEIQLRFRKGQDNWHTAMHDLPQRAKYKRGYFAEWRWGDRIKDKLLPVFDYYLDTTSAGNPAIVPGTAYRDALSKAAAQPFRMVPYFDPGVWGGDWMKTHFDLPENGSNYAWSFDGVPEENSLLLDFGSCVVETPALNLVYAHPRELLGDCVHARFGKEFPIRFDMLDTMHGQNLSLQVHPLTEYIQSHFHMHYTQDESYYLLDTWGHSSTITNPYDTMVLNLDMRKNSYASKAHEAASLMLCSIAEKKGDMLRYYNTTGAVRAVGVSHTSQPQLIEFYIETLALEDVEVRDLAGNLYTCQVSPHPRGRKISFIDTLSYGEEKEYIYTARHKAPETLNTRHCYMGAEEVRDIVNDYDPVTYRLPYEVENKFFRICYKPGDGITSFVDKRTGTEMAGTAIPFFTPVYQRTPLHQEVPFSSYEERRALGRNIRGKHAETHIGKLMEITCMEHGPVFTQLRLHYSLAGTVKADVLLKLYEAIPRIDFTLELGKTISDEVESVFLSLDLNRPGNGTVLRKGAREAFRPGIDQLPGTCMEFYMSDDGAARLSPEGGVLIAARDVPMFYTGEMQHHPIRLCDGAAENNARPLYSWVMNNNWETNFKMDLSGFCQYDYSLWLTDISDPEQAMDELHEQLFDPYVLIVR